MKKGVVILTLLLAVSFATSVAAVGVSSPYWKEHPLVLAPGQSSEFDMDLQNLVGGDDFIMKVSITGGEEIASIVGDTEYDLKAGTISKVRVRVEAPVDAAEGDTYLVTLAFQTVTSGEGGGLQLGLAIEKSFKVDVEIPMEEKEEETAQAQPAFNATYVGVVVIIAILVLLWWLLQRKNKRR